MSNTIILSGGYKKIQSLTINSSATLKPGMIAALNSSGELIAQATEGAACEKLVILEDALQGKTVNDAYTAGTVADAAVIFPGSEAQVLLKAGEKVVVGDYVTGAGAGKFQKLEASQTPLAVALEACDLTESDAVDTLVAVRFL